MSTRYKFSRVHDAFGIERHFYGAQNVDPERTFLRREPGQVVLADPVMMADRAASPDDGIACGLFDGAPLTEFVIELARKDAGEIKARTIDVGVAYVTTDDAAPAGAGRSLPYRGLR